MNVDGKIFWFDFKKIERSYLFVNNNKLYVFYYFDILREGFIWFW